MTGNVTAPTYYNWNASQTFLTSRNESICMQTVFEFGTKISKVPT